MASHVNRFEGNAKFRRSAAEDHLRAEPVKSGLVHDLSI